MLINGFLRACLPLYPDDFNLRLVVLSLTVLRMLALHFFAKVLADDLRFSFTSLVRHLSSLSVVSEGLPERFNVLTFPLHRNFLRMVAMVPLGRFVSLAIAVIDAPPLSIPTINDRSSSVNSFPLPIFASVWLQ